MCGTGGRAQCRVTRQCCNCSLPAFDINCLGVSANALFYQFGEENARLSVIESLATRLIVGVLSSLVVFVPTTIIGILFKHTRPRTFVGKHFDEYTADDLDSMKIDVRLCLARQIASTNWLTRLPFMCFSTAAGGAPGNVHCQAQLVPACVPGLAHAVVGGHHALLHRRGGLDHVLLRHAPVRRQV